MIDRKSIGSRFFSCYPDAPVKTLAEMWGTSLPMVSQWQIKSTVPWSRIKFLSDSQAISWDWLMEGVEPKKSAKKAVIPDSKRPEFDRIGINHRFLSLFDMPTQTDLAKLLNVHPSQVSGWSRCYHLIRWDVLDTVISRFGLRWDWIMDGLEPKYREQKDGGKLASKRRGKKAEPAHRR